MQCNQVFLPYCPPPLPLLKESERAQHSKFLLPHYPPPPPVLRRKSQRIKTIGQAKDFLQTFKSIPQGMGFFPKSPSFLFGNHKTFDKSSVWFFWRFLKSIGWYGISYGFLVVLYLFRLCFILICTNIHFIKCRFMTSFQSIFWYRLCLIHSPPLSPPSLAVFTTGRQAEFRICLKYLYFLIKMFKTP